MLIILYYFLGSSLNQIQLYITSMTFIVLLLLNWITQSQLIFPLKHNLYKINKQIPTSTQETGFPLKLRRHMISSRGQQAHRHNLKQFKPQLNQKYNLEQSQKGQSAPYFYEVYQLFNTGSAFLTLQMKVGGYFYKLMISTGSSDFVIKGENSTGNPQYKYHCGLYCIVNNPNYVLRYEDGKLFAYAKQLNVEIGQHSFNESVLVAYVTNQNFQKTDGILGLSYPKVAKNPQPTFIETLINLGYIKEHAFGVNINMQSTGRSFIAFGGMEDSQFYEGQLTEYQIISNQFYIISFQGISFGNSNMIPLQYALLDTGTTCIVLSSKFEEEILSQFNKGENSCYFQVREGNKAYSKLKCMIDNFEQLPQLHLSVGSKIYRIEKEYYLRLCAKLEFDLLYNRNPQRWYCLTFIEIGDISLNQIILGDGFFNRFYTIFNIQKNTVSIAQNRENITLNSVKNFYAKFSTWKK